MIGSRQIEHREEALKILDQRLDAVGLPDFFGQTESTLVVAEDAEAFRQIGDNAVPTVEGAADLVQENHSRTAFALESVMNADPVGLNERQWLSPCPAEPSVYCTPLGTRATAVAQGAGATHLSLVSRRPMNGEPLACPSSL